VTFGVYFEFISQGERN